MTEETAPTKQGIWHRVRDLLVPTDWEGGGSFGKVEAGVLLVTAIGLTTMQFGGAERVFLSIFGSSLRAGVTVPIGLDPETAALIFARDHPFYDLYSLSHWVAFCVIGYVLLPCLFMKYMGLRIRDCNLEFGGFWKHGRIYLGLFALVMVPVVIVSFTPEYQAIYPFYRLSSRSWYDLIAWELAYGVQFLALEFFFRGFLLQGLRRWIGYGAVFVMVVPYCMIHFQKTGTESLGAIIAGLILGSLAMRYRSIWGGVFLHWGVAISMDVLSLVHRGKLPTTLFPPNF